MRFKIIGFFLILLHCLSTPSSAQSAFDDIDQIKSKDEQSLDSQDDYRDTPYTKYGEFNEEEDEAEAALFFRFGRFFGVSLGVGISSATGNRGLLWQGGFPLISVKMHYWFNFNFAIDLELANASHFFIDTDSSTVDVTLLMLSSHLKYYINTSDLTAAVTFASPYLVFGGGAFTKTEFSPTSGNEDIDSKFGVTLGAGLEFVASPKEVYIAIEGVVSFVNFEDRNTTDFSGQGVSDLGGAFARVSANVMFTW